MENNDERKIGGKTWWQIQKQRFETNSDENEIENEMTAHNNGSYANDKNALDRQQQ